MAWTSTKRRPKAVASNDVGPLSDVLHRTFVAARESTQIDGETDLGADSPFWVEYADQLDWFLRIEAAPARHRSDD